MLQLAQYIKNKSFPCIMAKAVQKVGLFKIIELDISKSPEANAKTIMAELSPFIVKVREKTNRLSSFVVSFKYSQLTFSEFETYFWRLLESLRKIDKKYYLYDKRVSSNPLNTKYSFSLQGEAFFIILLHPQSPRLARQTTSSIVFNPHQQFEKLRKSGTYLKIRNLIRKRDIDLQGNINPTLKDFGEDSEILQYSGTAYQSVEEILGKFEEITNDE